MSRSVIASAPPLPPMPSYRVPTAYSSREYGDAGNLGDGLGVAFRGATKKAGINTDGALDHAIEATAKAGKKALDELEKSYKAQRSFLQRAIDSAMDMVWSSAEKPAASHKDVDGLMHEIKSGNLYRRAQVSLAPPASASNSRSLSGTKTVSPSDSPTRTIPESDSPTGSISDSTSTTKSTSPSGSVTITMTSTPPPSTSLTGSISESGTGSTSITSSVSFSPTISKTSFASRSATSTMSVSFSSSITPSKSVSSTVSITRTPSNTPSTSFSASVIPADHYNCTINVDGKKVPVEYLMINGTYMYSPTHPHNPIVIPKIPGASILAIDSALEVETNGSFAVKPFNRELSIWNITEPHEDEELTGEIQADNDLLYLDRNLPHEAFIYAKANNTLTHVINGQAVSQIEVKDIISCIAKEADGGGLSDAEKGGIAAGVIGVAGALTAAICGRRGRGPCVAICGAEAKKLREERGRGK